MFSPMQTAWMQVVVGLLNVLGEDLHPAAVARAHRVGVVAVDVDVARQRAVDDRQDHGLAHRGDDVEDLPHQRKAVGGGRVHHAATGGRGGETGAHRGVLGLDRDEVRVHLAVGDELREVLHDLGGRGDRVGRHHVGVDLAHGLRHGLIAFKGDSLTHCSLLLRLPGLIRLELAAGDHGDAVLGADRRADSAALAVVG
jgi:hypothetical protein